MKIPTYTNYGDGRAGDASAYVAAVNAQGLCGFTNWRLPTVTELQSLVDYGKPYPGPTIDTNWFPHTLGLFYWTSESVAGAPVHVWGVSFDSGFVDGGNRGGSQPVRLVRASQ